MPESREVRCYEYVSVPYEQVSDLLRSDAKTIFSRATASTADRVRELIATLRLNVGPLEVGVDVRLQLTLMADELSATGEPRTRLDFTWEAAQSAGFFPTMEATLSAYPLSPGETQLDLHGRYRPPLGTVGTAVDAAVGHRIAEATLLRLLRDLRTEITTSIASRGRKR
jgi:hypothetical protein